MPRGQSPNSRGLTRQWAFCLTSAGLEIPRHFGPRVVRADAPILNSGWPSSKSFGSVLLIGVIVIKGRKESSMKRLSQHPDVCEHDIAWLLSFQPHYSIQSAYVECM